VGMTRSWSKPRASRLPAGREEESTDAGFDVARRHDGRIRGSGTSAGYSRLLNKYAMHVEVMYAGCMRTRRAGHDGGERRT
jgi:hypothetical protein